MDKKLICNNKFEFVHHTIGLPVSLSNLPNEIIFEDNVFLLRSEHHVSLVCIGEIIKKYNITIINLEDKIINDFCEFSQINNISPVYYTNEFKFVARDDLRSIDLINKKYNLSIEYPPTHVTLYTLESKLGIYLTDSNDIKNLTIPIPNPIGHSL